MYPIPNSTLFKFLLVAVVFTTVASAYDGPVCCQKAARTPDLRRVLGLEPWYACSLNQTDQYPEGTTFPSVNITMGWCRENCPGFQYSTLQQWLQPLATWIAPYIGLLLLCPTGTQRQRTTPDRAESWKPSKPWTWLHISSRRESKSSGTWNWLMAHWMVKEVWDWFKDRATENFPEYVSLVGDPGSAICGAFSEIYADVKMLAEHQDLLEQHSKEGVKWIVRILRKIKLISRPKADPTHDVQVDCTVLRVLIMVGDTDFNEKDIKMKDVASFKKKIRKDLGLPPSQDLTPSGAPSRASSQAPSVFGKCPKEAMTMAMRALVEARLDFFNAVFLPVVLMLAVTASVFYDAYTKLGDNDTAHGLAFGVWYSWLLVLCVAGNCFASSTNAGLTRTVLEPLIDLSERRVPLRERFVNWKLWEQWKGDPGSKSDEEKKQTEKEKQQKKAMETEHFTPELRVRDWMKFFGGQLLGWACVAFPSACAAAISYTTPTVGLGCRSFTFLLYGTFAFGTAILNVGCQWADQRLDWNVKRSADKKLRRRVRTAVTVAYWFLTSLNAIVIFIGTVLHLVGVYRSCRCKLLFAADDRLVELNSNTQLAVDNADKFWLAVGYVAFGCMWFLCGVVIAVRKYITVHMDEWKDQLELARKDSVSPKATNRQHLEISPA